MLVTQEIHLNHVQDINRTTPQIYTNGTLRINKIKPGQTGTYSVKALNTEGSSKANVLINIVCKFNTPWIQHKNQVQMCEF